MNDHVMNLDPFTEKDFDFLLNWNPSKKDFLRWDAHAFTYPLNQSKLEKYFSDCLGKSNTSYQRKAYKVIVQDQIIGYVELNMIDQDNRSAYVDHLLIRDKKNRGKGFGQRLIQKVLEIGFGDLSLHRISLSVPDNNHQAIKCYENAGFVKEGLIRDVLRVNEEYWSYFVMGMLTNEWKT